MAKTLLRGPGRFPFWADFPGGKGGSVQLGFGFREGPGVYFSGGDPLEVVCPISGPEGGPRVCCELGFAHGRSKFFHKGGPAKVFTESFPVARRSLKKPVLSKPPSSEGGSV